MELRSANAPTKLSSKKVKSGGDKEKNVTRYVEGESSDEEMEVDVQEGSDAGISKRLGLAAKATSKVIPRRARKSRARKIRNLEVTMPRMRELKKKTTTPRTVHD